jgi:hypothetical protein
MISVSRTGTTRFVLVVGRWAIKFARSARGRRCNRYETDLFASVDERRRSMLCPVRWHTASGWLIAMTAAIQLTETEKDKLIDSDGFPD